MGKLVVLKPVVWNSQGYNHPTGENTSAGYAGEHGYGHEEWNGRADWIWKNWKVFHTQGKGKMFEYAKQGDLGIIMTTMKDGQFFAVGAACCVYENDAQSRADIAQELNLKANGDQLWTLPLVRSLKKSRSDFNAHWEQAYGWIQWRCPQSHFLWFDPPIPFTPEAIIPSTDPSRPRQATVKMHGSYQALRPDQALAILGNRLPPSHSIRAWLSTPDFDTIKNKANNAPPPRTSGGPRSAGTATDPYTRYLQENEFQITPKHHFLQSAFKEYLKLIKAENIQENISRVDIRYNHTKTEIVLAEIKPTDSQNTRFAIRTAIGQLLDYRQNFKKIARLLVVISQKPDKDEDVALALSNGIGIAWQQKKGFEIIWPDAIRI